MNQEITNKVKLQTMRRKSFGDHLILRTGILAITLAMLISGFLPMAEGADIWGDPHAVRFPPVTVTQGDGLRVNIFNHTDQPVLYNLQLLDGLTGQMSNDDGGGIRFFEAFVDPQQGFSWEINVPVTDSLVVITIIGTFWDREGIAHPSPPSLVTAEVVRESGVVILLLPAVQACTATDQSTTDGYSSPTDPTTQ